MKRQTKITNAHFLAVILILILLLQGCVTRSKKSGSQTDSGTVKDNSPSIETVVEAQALFAAGIVHELNSETEAASESFFRAAKKNPHDSELLAQVSARLIEEKQWERARQVIKWATQLPNADEMTLVRLGFVQSQLGNREASNESYREAIRRAPTRLPFRQNLYLNHLAANKPQDALEVLNDAAAEPEIDAEFLANLAELYANLARQFPDQRLAARGKALEVLNRAATNSPLPSPLQLKIGDGFNLLGDRNSAAKMYLAVLDQASPTSPLQEILRSKLVDIFIRNGDHQRATVQINELLKNNPTNAAAHYLLGSIAFDNKKWEEAISRFRLTTELNPDIEQAHYDLASALIGSGDGTNAFAALEQTRQRFPQSFPAEFLTALALCETKHYTNALEHFQAAEKIGLAGETNRLNAGFYFQFGAASERAGLFDQAAKHFEHCLKLSPDNADAKNYLGYMWADRGENLERAKELISEALKAEPDNDAFLDSMGWVLFKLGDFPAAIEHLLKAVSKSEKPDPTLFDHLGDAYAAVKEFDKAREAWAKSVEAEPNEIVQKKLDALNANQKP
jgi:tetratricopeptide (TPR) repeat protein